MDDSDIRLGVVSPADSHDDAVNLKPVEGAPISTSALVRSVTDDGGHAL
ncbi:hypothetical protein [Mesorhizobium sp. M1365]